MRGEALPDGGAATAVRTEVLPAFYQDSVVLMRIAAQVRGSPAVREVALFMGTPANHALLEQAGLATPAGRGAGPNDLIATVSADDEATADSGPDSAVVEDQGSRNGVFVNDHRVTRERLRDGDILMFGKARFRFHLEPPCDAARS